MSLEREREREGEGGRLAEVVHTCEPEAPAPELADIGIKVDVLPAVPAEERDADRRHGTLRTVQVLHDLVAVTPVQEVEDGRRVLLRGHEERKAADLRVLHVREAAGIDGGGTDGEDDGVPFGLLMEGAHVVEHLQTGELVRVQRGTEDGGASYT